MTKIDNEVTPVETKDEVPTSEVVASTISEEEEEITPEMYMNHRLALAKQFIDQAREAISQNSVDNELLNNLVSSALQTIVSPYPEEIPVAMVYAASQALEPFIAPFKSILGHCETVGSGLSVWDALPAFDQREILSKQLEETKSVSLQLEDLAL